MKKITCTLLTFALLVLLQACYKDLGNYDYHEIDEITITNLPAEVETLTRRVTIRPVLRGSIAGRITETNEDDYTYKWYAYTGVDRVDTFARVRQLVDYPLDALPTGIYNVVYRVTNKSTNWFTEAQFELRIKSSTTEGYVVMCEVDGKMRVDMVSWYQDTDEEVSQFHVLTNVAGALPADMGAPVKVLYYSEHREMPAIMTSPDNRAFYFLGTNRTERLKSDFTAYDGSKTGQSNVSYQFIPGGYCPPGFVAQNLQNEASSSMLMGAGNLYNSYPPGPIYWGNPVNTIDGTTFFTASPIYASLAAYGYLVFDDDTKSFCYCGYTGSKSSQVTDCTNMGKELIWMGGGKQFLGGPSSTDLRYYAIMKDGSDYWMLRLTGPDRVVEYWQKMNATDIASATCFTVGGPYVNDLYYAAGGKVYKYNIPGNQSVQVLNRPGETITYLGFGNHNRSGFGENAGYDPFKYIMVGSYNGAEGILGCYTVNEYDTPWVTCYKHPTTGEVFQWRGMGKIASIVWKYD